MGCVVNPRIFEVVQPDDIQGKRVLISPLNWGFGHVSRCVGLIHQLKEQGNHMVMACDEDQESVFRSYFPEEIYVRHAGYPFEFRGKGHFALDLMKRSTALHRRLKEELRQTEQLVERHQIDLVISDHRYGFYSDRVHSIFMTHQYNLPVSWYQTPVDTYHKKQMDRFGEVWILDDPDNRLAGRLSRVAEADNVTFIGPYSRFSLYEAKEKTMETVAIISGPEVYAKQLVSTIVTEHPEALFVCPEGIQLPENVRRVEGGWREQDAVILSAKRIISRSGYSTIMDVDVLQAEGIYYPTPGQAEQQYLFELSKGGGDQES